MDKPLDQASCTFIWLQSHSTSQLIRSSLSSLVDCGSLKHASVFRELLMCKCKYFGGMATPCLLRLDRLSRPRSTNWSAYCGIPKRLKKLPTALCKLLLMLQSNLEIFSWFLSDEWPIRFRALPSELARNCEQLAAAGVGVGSSIYGDGRGWLRRTRFPETQRQDAGCISWVSALSRATPVKQDSRSWPMERDPEHSLPRHESSRCHLFWGELQHSYHRKHCQNISPTATCNYNNLQQQYQYIYIYYIYIVT